MSVNKADEPCHIGITPQVTVSRTVTVQPPTPPIEGLNMTGGETQDGSRTDQTAHVDYWTSQSLRRLDSTNSRGDRPKPQLIVDGLSKVDQAMQRQATEETTASPLLLATVSRWFLVIFLFTGFLACLVFSRLAAVRLGSHLFAMTNASIHDKSPGKNETLDESSATASSTASSRQTPGAESAFLMLLITLLLPYGITLLRSLWCGGFRADRPWPSLKAFSLGLLSTVMESVGISLFTMKVLGESPNYVTVWIMNGVFFVPIIQQLFQHLYDFKVYGFPLRKWILGALLAAFVAEMIGIILACVLETGSMGLSYFGEDVWEIPVSLTLISASWTPYLQQQQLLPNKNTLKSLIDAKPVLKYKDVSGQVVDPGPHSDVTSGVASMGDESCSNLSNIWTSSDMSDKEAEWLVFTYPQLSARWKNSILQNAIKIILILSICLVLEVYHKQVHIDNLWAGIDNVHSGHPVFVPFMVSIFCSFGGYTLGWLACTTCLQRPCFATPLALSSPVCLIIVLLWSTSLLPSVWPGHDPTEMLSDHSMALLVPAAVFLIIAQIISTGVFIFKTQTIVMEMESHLFWLPGYSSIFLEQQLLLYRKNIHTDICHDDPKKKAQMTRVYICTTMYREVAHEQEQLLKSIRLINIAKQQSNRNFESHIFFDNGVRGTRLSTFALQLVSIAKKTLGIQTANCAKTKTPYGMCLAWALPNIFSHHTATGMRFVIHLKDNKLVKNKKRWSQVMYMSYILDYRIRQENGVEDETFILTTDADIEFKPESVEALLDLMTRDQHVGAVCARTFPIGSGPIYWFQIFDYAIGHWLQKATNHVLGSVLCSPGCFSVFRCSALRDILPTYATKVDKASEFLTKDMGEDRWLCTLLVKSGWRLEYCAAADCSTYCPEEFDEFFKQRRRWIPSTLANMAVLLQEWSSIRSFNKQISLMFLFYQALLLFSTLVTPSVCILFITGGLYYAWDMDQTFSLVCLILVCLGYTLICLYCSQETQLQWAKVLTTVFSLIMTAVCIGTIVQLVGESKVSSMHDNLTTPSPRPSTNRTTPAPPPATTARDLINEDLFVENITHSSTKKAYVKETVTRQVIPAAPLHIAVTGKPTEVPEGSNIPLPMSVVALYLSGVVGIFLVTGMVHLPEFYCLIHGLLYLLCLPSSSIILMIYSVCNITDRSWGTREEKSSAALPASTESWTDKITRFMRAICFCCRDQFDKLSSNGELPVFVAHNDDIEEEAEGDGEQPETTSRDNREPPSRVTVSADRLSAMRPRTPERSQSIISSGCVFTSVPAEIKPISVARWLPRDLRGTYSHVFESNGYDDTSFISGIGHKEMEQIGISSPVHRNKLLMEIRDLPEYDIDPSVPTSVKDWLDSVGLGMYKTHFRTCQITTTRDLENLKAMSNQELKTDLGIRKPGHMRRLLMAIQALRYPTKSEIDISDVKYEMEAVEVHELKTVSPEENEFWDELRNSCLLPDSVAFAHDHDLKVKLTEMRDSTLMLFVISNAMWMILILTLIAHSRLNVLDSNLLGLSFLVIFGLIQVIQFLSMLVHRCNTWIHLVARAPLRCGAPSNTQWSFSDKCLTTSVAADDQAAHSFMEQYNRLANLRYQQSVVRRRGGIGGGGAARGFGRSTSNRRADDRQPLLSSQRGTINEAARV